MELAATLATACCAVAAASGPSGDDAYRFARSLAIAGPRPAAGERERKAHARVAKRFRTAGLKVERDTFSVPGKGRSRNVVGVLDTPATCLRIVMAHADTVPPSPGADDNASGVGVLVAIGDVLRASGPSCDVWLIATGAEERIYTGRDDHLGALAVVRRLKRLNRRKDVQWALSIDEVGRGSSFWIRSRAKRARIERPLIATGRSSAVGVRWAADGAGGGNSDHRELNRAGYVAAKLGVPNDSDRHTAADKLSRIQRGSFSKALDVVWPVISG